jgi:two-component sensor histidine kinase/CheY-like chemotaxis protein
MPDKPVVLVVEDEMVLRMKAVDIVEDAGYTAIEAVSADEAIGILEAREDISLLFTDIQMPGTMDGLMLAHSVFSRWPHIKIVLVSGQIVVTDEEKPADSRFFGKPLTVSKMITELQEMIGKGAIKIFPVAVQTKDSLTADNDTLRNLLTQAGIDAKAGVQHSNDDRRILSAENDSLRLSLEQAGVDAAALLVQAGIDAEAREARDNLQKLINDELHHRIKNTLAIVGAIASQTLRTASSTSGAAESIENRLVALGRAHDTLIRVNWANTSLVRTIKDATEPYDATGVRFVLNGPDIMILSGAVIAFALTLNELCTNTTKFGALSEPSGKVEITWKIDEATGRLALTWREIGGPLVRAPTKQSFGTRMMKSLGQQLSGTVNLEYKPDGFVYTLDVPLKELTTKAGK